MQKAVMKHYELLQRELAHLKAKSNARTNTDLLCPDQSGKLELFIFSLLC